MERIEQLKLEIEEILKSQNVGVKHFYSQYLKQHVFYVTQNNERCSKYYSSLAEVNDDIIYRYFQREPKFVEDEIWF